MATVFSWLPRNPLKWTFATNTLYSSTNAQMLRTLSVCAWLSNKTRWAENYSQFIDLNHWRSMAYIEKKTSQFWKGLFIYKVFIRLIYEVWMQRDLETVFSNSVIFSFLNFLSRLIIKNQHTFWFVSRAFPDICGCTLRIWRKGQEESRQAMNSNFMGKMN